MNMFSLSMTDMGDDCRHTGTGNGCDRTSGAPAQRWWRNGQDVGLSIG